MFATKATAGQVRGHFLTPSGTGINKLTISAGWNWCSFAPTDFGERSSHTLIDIGNGGGNISALFSIYTSSALGASRYVIIPTTQVATNLVHQNHYIGYADQAYTDGQTATIKTYGNNVDTLTGLTVGTLYYVQRDGSLGTSADSTLSGYFIAGTPVAGTALSATKLLIRDPTVRV